jgi:parallel beta-helix repeat protein
MVRLPNGTCDLIDPGLLTLHPPIYIVGNNQFTNANGVVSGSGTKNDPYIIENWEINASNDNGIEIKSTTAYFIIRNCYIHNGSYSYEGIYLYFAKNGIIENNRLKNNDVGIYLYNSESNNVRNNTYINNNDEGIFLRYSDFNNITNNTCHLNKGSGILIEYSENNNISKNICSNNSVHGIYVDDSNNNEASNNICRSNNGYGLSLVRGDYNSIFNNTCSRNGWGGFYLYNSEYNDFYNNMVVNNKLEGMKVDYSSGNLIYNNYLKNTIDLHINEGYGNYWNISKTQGTNIVGGPYLGGNYWSKYNGYDTNGDMLGDTGLPYGPGDFHPLIVIKPPQITDYTEFLPKTGDQNYINATVFCLGKVKKVCVEYYCDDDQLKNETMTQVVGNEYLGNYSFEISIPDRAFNFYYKITARDIPGNWSNTSVVRLKVFDNDAPVIQDLSSTTAVTGEDFIFNFTVVDNINVSSVELVFGFDTGFEYNTELILKNGFYTSNYTIPMDAVKLLYTVSASDNASNWATLGLKALNITDNENPIIIDYSGIPTTGDEFLFWFNVTDNVRVNTIELEYWVDKEAHQNIKLLDLDNNIIPDSDPTYTIQVPSNAFKLYWIITVTDVYHNLVQDINSKNVVDNDLPIIYDNTNTTPETGEYFRLIWLVSENRELKNIFVEYWFNSSALMIEYFDENDYIFAHDLTIPDNAVSINYSITAEDGGGNTVRFDNFLWVSDSILPVIHNITEQPPTTGDDYEIKAFATDNIQMESFHLEYWFNEAEKKNFTFTGSYSVQVPKDATTLSYVLTAVDTSNNLQLLEMNLAVLDNDPPEIEDNPPEPTTGDPFKFDIKITDNIWLESNYIEYWFDDGIHMNSSFYLISNVYSIVPPNSSKILHYKIYAEDWNKNHALVEVDINVTDNDAPDIVDLSKQVKRIYQILVEVNDNREVLEVKVNYWFENGIIRVIQLQYQAGMYEGTINIPGNEKNICYVISAMDNSSNNKISDEYEIDLDSKTQVSSSPDIKMNTGLRWQYSYS